MQLSDIIAQLEAQAEAVWKQVEAKGIQIVQELVPVIEDGLAKAVSDFGALACQLVVQFMEQEFENLTGAAKHTQVVDTLIESAKSQGTALARQDAEALAKNAFVAITGKAPG